MFYIIAAVSVIFGLIGFSEHISLLSEANNPYSELGQGISILLTSLMVAYLSLNHKEIF